MPWFRLAFLKGRVPRPRELEVTVLAYAPHFLGLAAAAATEKLKLNIKTLSDSAAAAASSADGAVNTADAATDTAAAAAAAAKSARQKRAAKRAARAGRGAGAGAGQEGAVSVPTGLSLCSGWPDEEAARKKTDVDKHRADPIRVGLAVKFYS